jgi:TadE-like protein
VSERGQVLVEFVLMLPFLLMILLGGCDLVWVETQRASVSYLATQAAVCNARPGCDPNSYVMRAEPGFALDPAATGIVIFPGEVDLSYRTRGLFGIVRVNFTVKAATP